MANRVIRATSIMRLLTGLALASPAAALAGEPAAPPPQVLIAPPGPPSAPPAPPAAPAAVDPTRLALARDVIATGFPPEKREALFFAAVDGLIAQMRKVMFAELNNDPGAAAIVNRKVDEFLGKSKGVMVAHIPALMDGMAQAYAREFTVEELTQYRAFAATPGGQHFFLRSSAIISDPAFAAANESYMRELQPLIGKMRDELTAEMIAYFKVHPPKANTRS